MPKVIKTKNMVISFASLDTVSFKYLLVLNDKV